MHPGIKWVLQPVTDGEWWNVVQSNAALSATCNGISVTALNLYINVIRISMILRYTLVQ